MTSLFTGHSYITKEAQAQRCKSTRKQKLFSMRTRTVCLGNIFSSLLAVRSFRRRYVHCRASRCRLGLIFFVKALALSARLDERDMQHSVLETTPLRRPFYCVGTTRDIGLRRCRVLRQGRASLPRWSKSRLTRLREWCGVVIRLPLSGLLQCD